MRLYLRPARLVTVAIFVFACVMFHSHAGAADWSTVKASLNNKNGAQLTNDQLQSELVRSNFTGISSVRIMIAPSPSMTAAQPPAVPVEQVVQQVAAQPAVAEEKEQAQKVSLVSTVPSPRVAQSVGPVRLASVIAPSVVATSPGADQTSSIAPLQQAANSPVHSGVALSRTQNFSAQTANPDTGRGINSINVLLPVLRQMLSIGSVRLLDASGSYEAVLPRPDQANLRANRAGAVQGTSMGHVFYFQQEPDGTIDFNVELSLKPSEIAAIANDVSSLRMMTIAAPNQLVPATGLQQVQVFYHGDKSTLLNSLTTGLPKLEADLGYRH